jgi:NADH dehydrogenase
MLFYDRCEVKVVLEPTPQIPRVLVTGASGFVGQHIVSELLNQEYAVSALVRNPASFHRPEVAVYPGDILAPASLRPAMEGCDAVIHLVGIIAESRRATFEQIHVAGTRNVIECAKNLGIK